MGLSSSPGRCTTVAQVGCTERPGCTARHLPQGLTRFSIPCPRSDALTNHSYYSDLVFYRDGRPTRAVWNESALVKLRAYCEP